MELLREIKETVMVVPDINTQGLPQPTPFELPDGMKIEIAPKAINDLAELFFHRNTELLQYLGTPSTYKGI
jgi:hypothetical protein